MKLEDIMELLGSEEEPTERNIRHAINDLKQHHFSLGYNSSYNDPGLRRMIYREERNKEVKLCRRKRAKRKDL